MTAQIIPINPPAQERRVLIDRSRKMLADIEQIFTDAEYWNSHHRDQAPINPDPYGELRRAADGLRTMLEKETTRERS